MSGVENKQGEYAGLTESINSKPTISDWPMKKVDEICDLGRGRVISQEEIQKHPGIYPVYSSQSKDGGIFGALDTYDFDGDYVTWTTDAAHAGTVFFRSGKFNCTNVCGTLKAKQSEVSHKFIARALSLVAKNHVSYIGNPKLMNNVMAGIKIPFPPSSEQHAIAAVLENLDATIEKSEALIAKLKQVRAGMLHDLLTCGVDESGEIRDPHQHPKQFDNSALGIIPKEWQVLPIGSACLSAIDGPFGSNLKSSHYIEGNGIRVVRLQNIGIGDFLDDDKAFISHEHAKSLHHHKVVAGDLLVASLGDENHPIARACVYPEGLGDAINKADCFRVRMNPSMAINEFTEMLLNCPATRKGFFGLAQGVTRDRINLGNLKSLLLALPPVSEQKLIVKYYGALNMDLEHQISAQSKLKTLKQGLTADLLTGRVRVPPDLELP